MTIEEKPIEEWTREDFRAEASRLLDNDDLKSDEVMCGAMMIAAMVVGTRIDRIIKKTGYGFYKLRPFWGRLVDNEIFVGNEVACKPWTHEETGGLAFCLDVAVGTGMLVKTYGDTDEAESSKENISDKAPPPQDETGGEAGGESREEVPIIVPIGRGSGRTAMGS